jgi:hypothetical protein
VAPPAAADPRDDAPAPTAAQQLVELVNAERLQHGLRPLAVLPRLERLATAHSATMGGEEAPCRQPYLHHNPRLAERVQPAHDWGENVACGANAERMHRALMASPAHRRNVLDPRWNALGVGTYDGAFLWATEDFARVDAAEVAAAERDDANQLTAVVVTRAATRRRTPRAAAGLRFDHPDAWPLVGRDLDRWCHLPRLFGA